jgi:hypothetical protein
MSASPPPVPPVPPTRPFFVSPPQLTLLVVCVVSVYFIIGFFGKSAESYRINQRAAAVRKEIAVLEAQNSKLKERVAYLSTDGFVETTARDKLNLIKPGDHSLVTIDAEPQVAGVAPPPDPTEAARLFPGVGHRDDWIALLFSAR